MCDQDHFEDDRKEFEFRGLVTRPFSSAFSWAPGVAMMLPKVVNGPSPSPTWTSRSNRRTAKTAMAYFVHPSSGTAPGVLVWPDIFGLRPAFPHDGQAARGGGFISVLVVKPVSIGTQGKAPTAGRGSATPIAELNCRWARGAEREHAHDRREGVSSRGWISSSRSPRTARSARRAIAWAARWHSAPRPRSPDRVGRGPPRSTAGGLVTDMPNSPHLQTSKTKASLPHRDRGERRYAVAQREERAEGDVREERSVRGDRSVRRAPRTAGARRNSGVYNEPQAEKAWTRLMAPVLESPRLTIESG